MTSDAIPGASRHDTPEDVLALLSEQAALYERLDACAARQRELITLDDTGPLLSLLAERQKLSVDLAASSRRLEPVRQHWDRYRDRFTEAQRVEADRSLETIKTRLRCVIERDEEDARLLSVRKQAAGDALRATHTTGQALSAYRVPAPLSSRSGQLDEAL